jgi:hypothetical protein
MWPLAARAQQARTPVVAFLGVQSASAFAERMNAFKQGFCETGYVEGRNVARLATTLKATGSMPPVKMIGIFVVAAFAAKAAGKPAKAMAST